MHQVWATARTMRNVRPWARPAMSAKEKNHFARSVPEETKHLQSGAA